MEPITREEYYLAKIAGTYEGNTPEPVTIEEYYLATMAGDYSGNTPQPVTRLQYYMAKVAGVWGGSIPAPVTRLEYYWAAIASGEGKVFPPVTREEHFLVLVADAYSVVLTVVTGNPALLENSKGNRGLESLTLHGISTQGSTTGAQLLKNYDYTVNFVEGAHENVSKINEELSAGNIFVDGGYLSFISHETLPFEVQFEFYNPDDFNYYKTLAICKPKKGFNKMELDGYEFANTQKKVSMQIRSVYRPSENISWHVSELFVKAGKAENPFEPYTGGAPSPSPPYPQEIENAGMDGEIGIEVDNNGYIQKGTYFFDVRPFLLKKGYTYHIKCKKIIGNDINCFVLNDYNKNFNNSAELFNYGYTTKKLITPNSTGIVDEECRMPMRYDRDGYTFTVKAEGLYLYQAVNEPAKNTDEFYVGYVPNIVNEEYKKQTLIIPTPNGLPGIPVSSDGNYTDEKGQQWVADEIDLARGERVKWIGEYELTGKENVADFGLRPRVRVVSITIPDAYIDAENHGDLKAVMSNKYKQVKFNELANNINLIARGQQRNICISIPTDIGIEDFKTDLSNQYASGRPVKVFYKLDTPIRTPLPPETIAAYKALRTYSPTTTVINYAGAGMSVGYAKMK